MRKNNKALTLLMLLFTVWLGVASPVLATSIDDTLAEIAEIEKQIQYFEKQNSGLSGDISKQQNHISNNQEEINALNAQLEESTNKMNDRLRVMYMFSVEDYLQLLFTARDMADFFSRLDVAMSIYQKDRNALKAIVNTISDIEEKKRENESALVQLETQQKDIMENISYVEELLAERNGLLQDQQVAEAYARQQAETAAKKAASDPKPQQSQPSEPEQTASDPTPSDPTPSSPSSSYTPSITGGYATQRINPDDFDLICAVVRHEGGASYEGSLGVISCVMNRCDVGWGGTDPKSVLTAPYQFASYFDGYYEQFMGADIPETRQAVIDCVEGGYRSHEFLSFRGYYIEGALNIYGNYYYYPKDAY